MIHSEKTTVTASTTSYVTGVGLRNGVLQIVGTISRDMVRLNTEGHHDQWIGIKTSFTDKEYVRTNTVSDIMILTGDGNDLVKVHKNISKPILIDAGVGDDILIVKGRINSPPSGPRLFPTFAQNG